MNVEKGAGKSRSSAERNSAESDSGERDDSLSEVQTLKRSKSKRELAEEVVFLRNNLRKSQVSLIGRFQRLLSINRSEMLRLKFFPKNLNFEDIRFSLKPLVDNFHENFYSENLPRRVETRKFLAMIFNEKN